MRRVGLTIGLTVVLAAAPASAQNTFKSGNWSGGAYFNGQQFSHCYVNVGYADGTQLFLQLTPQMTMYVGASKSSWNMDPTKQYDVSFEVDRYRPVFIMGEVGAAGQYSYVPGLTVQKAVAMAGGYTARANQGSVDITRDINGKVITGRVRTSDPLLPGDTVYVRERLF